MMKPHAFAIWAVLAASAPAQIEVTETTEVRRFGAAFSESAADVLSIHLDPVGSGTVVYQSLRPWANQTYLTALPRGEAGSPVPLGAGEFIRFLSTGSPAVRKPDHSFEATSLSVPGRRQVIVPQLSGSEFVSAAVLPGGDALAPVYLINGAGSINRVSTVDADGRHDHTYPDGFVANRLVESKSRIFTEGRTGAINAINAIYYSGLTGGVATELVTSSSALRVVATTPAEDGLVFQEMDRLKYTAIPRVGEPFTLAEAYTGDEVKFRENGSVLVRSGVQVFSVDLATGEQTEILESHVSGLVYSEDGSQMAYYRGGVSERPRVFTRSTDAGSPEIEVTAELAPPLGALPVAAIPIDTSLQFSPDGEMIAFIGILEGDGAYQLFSAPSDGSSPLVRLSFPPGPREDVRRDFAFTPDSAQILFRADHVINASSYLYRVPAAGGTPVQVNSSGDSPGGDVDRFATVADVLDGERVYFVGDLLQNGIDELFSASLTDGGPAQERVSSRGSVPDGTISEIKVTPDSRTAVYLADHVPGQQALYAAPAGGAPQDAPVLLTPMENDRGDVRSLFEITPDGKWVVYKADAITNTITELFIAPVSPPGAPKLLSEGLSGEDLGAEVFRFAISPDSSYVVCIVTSAAGERGYIIDLATGEATAIVIPLDGQIGSSSASRIRAISPDSRFIAVASAGGTALYEEATGATIYQGPDERGKSAFSPSGSHFAFLAPTGVRLVPTGGGPEIAVPGATDFAFGGGSLVTVGGATVEALDLTTGESKDLVSYPAQSIESAPAGDWFVLTGRPEVAVSPLATIYADGSELSPIYLQAAGRPHELVEFSVAGDSVLFQSDRSLYLIRPGETAPPSFSADDGNPFLNLVAKATVLENPTRVIVSSAGDFTGSAPKFIEWIPATGGSREISDPLPRYVGSENPNFVRSPDGFQAFVPSVEADGSSPGLYGTTRVRNIRATALPDDDGTQYGVTDPEFPGTLRTGEENLSLIFGSSVGVRFGPLPLERNAEVISARASFVRERRSVETDLRAFEIALEDSAEPAMLVDGMADGLTSRTALATGAPLWAPNGDEGERLPTPDFSTALKILTTRAGWEPDASSALVLIEANEGAVFDPFVAAEAGAATAPQLDIQIELRTRSRFDESSSPAEVLTYAFGSTQPLEVLPDGLYFTSPPGRSEVTRTVEISSDLDNWTTVAISTSGTPFLLTDPAFTLSGADSELVGITPPGGVTAFYRLRADP